MVRRDNRKMLVPPDDQNVLQVEMGVINIIKYRG